MFLIFHMALETVLVGTFLPLGSGLAIPDFITLVHWKLVRILCFIQPILIKLYSFRSNVICCIFGPAFGCFALQALVQIFIFNVFHDKKQKNAKEKEISCKNLPKNCFFFSLYQNAGLRFSWNKTLNQRFGSRFKNPFFCWILMQITNLFELFKLLSTKNVKKLRFWPAFGVLCTQMQVQIYNSC